jgi:methyl-accepting chemotaxis protein
MANLGYFTKAPEIMAKLEALSRSMATIEFELDGTIITANENFLATVGYSLNEIRGRKHSMFVEPAYANSAEYRQFWASLNHGEYQATAFRRIGKNGKEIWIQASYNPLIGRNGKPFKVIKFATDITAQKIQAFDYEGQINAISRSQAVIHFNLDGTVITANKNFLDALGYDLNEVQGKHHRIFCETAFASSLEYQAFWDDLRKGSYQAGQYKRVAKGGREVWIQASYNPIFDQDGKLLKVVKYATDITKEVEARRKTERAKSMIDESLISIGQSISTASDQAAAAASASTQTTNAAQAIAAGAEQMSGTVAEIAQSMTRSREYSERAFALTTSAGSSTDKLAHAAQAMNGIVNMIKDIAGQINMLSLNATIESARAGEAGRGFAVVANEVKNLAQQAAKATEQISSEIEALQGISTEVTGALSNIRDSISLVKESVVSATGAVEEQSVASREISSNMQQTVTAVATINDSLKRIAESAASVDQSVRDVRSASASLS